MRWLKLFFLAAFVVATGGLLLFGPRDSGRPTAPSGFTQVTYWEKWTGNEGAQMQIIVDDFNRTVGREKKIYVNCLTISNIEERTLAATAAGVPPDVAGVTDEQIAQFAALDALEPLEEMAAARGIRRDLYKPVCWDGCVFEGHLWALPSTPAPVALHYNKRVLEENADALRAAGFDPGKIPTTLAEFDRFARVLDKRQPDGRIIRAGYLAQEPGWFFNFTPYWFGGSYFDDNTGKFTLTSPAVVKTFEWFRESSLHYTPKAIASFRSGGGNGVNSSQNPFLVFSLAMEQQGSWMGNTIEELAPALNRWDRFLREEPGMIAEGLTDRDARWHRFEDEVGDELRAMSIEQKRAAFQQKIDAECKLRIEERRKHYEWGACAFPSAVPEAANATYTGFDALTIPRGAAHKEAAFEFIAYVNRQDVTEKLNMMHCKISPLRLTSENFRTHHPNPYIAVFEELAASPNSHGVPRCPIWPEVVSEMDATTQNVFLLKEEPAKALAEAQERLQARLDQFNARKAKRRAAAAHGGAP